MIALDTNVLARYLLADEPTQFAAAQRLMSGTELCTAPLTVLLELVWVLESRALARIDITAGLRALLGLAHFKPQQAPLLAQSLAWYEQGLDFADALHLAQCRDADSFASFDVRLGQRAGKLSTQPPVVKPA